MVKVVRHEPILSMKMFLAVWLFSIGLTFFAYTLGLMDGLYTTEPPPETAIVSTEWFDMYQQLVGAIEQVNAHKPPSKQWDEKTIQWFALRLLIASSKSGLDPRLILSVAITESSVDFTAVSSEGAIGIMQLMPSTAEHLGIDPYDPAQNLDGGAIYLASLLKKYNNNLKLALAAYNAGSSRVRTTLPSIRETRTYVNKISTRYNKIISGERLR